MLTFFAVENFRGFDSRIEWQLSNPSRYDFNNHLIRDGVVKNGIIYGANGSGKTNFGLAIFDIVNHLSQKHRTVDYYNNFVNISTKDALVSFEYRFKIGGTSIRYAYSKDSVGSLQKETLYADDKPIFEIDKKRDTIAISDNRFPMSEKVKDMLLHNGNNISIANYILSAYPLPKEHYLIKMRDFVDSMLWFRCLDTREFIGLETHSVLIEEYIIKNRLTLDFERFLQQVSEQSFQFAMPQADDKLLYCHVGATKVPFLKIASTGTQALELLYYWIQRMSEASFVFIDEFDAFYHFKLSYNVCQRLFRQNCQLFTSSHNTYLMTNDLLRPDCNFIISHNSIQSLNHCTEKELRFAHNIEKLYRGGTFC